MSGRHEKQSVAVLYGSMSLFLTLFHNIFLLYYVDMFLSVYQISSVAFFFGQVFFLLWNSINDPLFGWLTDRHLLNSGNTSSKYDVIIRRLSILKFSGPLLAFSFGLFWIRWMPTCLLWLQFVMCLCLYDTFLTAVDLQHTSLLADISVHLEHRAQLNKYSSISSTIGCLSVFLSYVFWNKSSILSFQVFCLSLSVFSAVGFYVSSSSLLRHYFTLHQVPSYSLSSTEHSLINIWKDNSTSSKYSTTKVAFQYFNELKTNHNFKCFFPVNLLQVFHCHFNSNFFPLFLQVLLSQQLSSGIGPILIGLSFLLPHLNNIYFLKLCNNHGVYKVIKILFSLKFIFAFIMMISGPDNLFLLCIFIASNRITTEGTCNLLNLVISDLVDEDYVMNRRKNPASALMFGMTSLLAKPGQTIAPLLGTWLLSVVTGENLYGLKGDAAIHFETGGGGVYAHNNRKNGCFLLLTILPLVVASLQLIFWRKFTLHGKNLKQVKERRINLESRRTILSV